MKDQVQNLRKREIKALAIYSGMTRQEILTALENCIFGNYKFLYISPERLDTEIFRTKLRSMKVSMITVDESHCISQWGYDFRPAYLKIAEIRGAIAGSSGTGTDGYGHSGSRNRYSGPSEIPGRKCLPNEL